MSSSQNTEERLEKLIKENIKMKKEINEMQSFVAKKVE